MQARVRATPNVVRSAGRWGRATGRQLSRVPDKKTAVSRWDTATSCSTRIGVPLVLVVPILTFGAGPNRGWSRVPGERELPGRLGALVNGDGDRLIGISLHVKGQDGLHGPNSRKGRGSVRAPVCANNC